jgi:glycosyltransferase involved in cell wall biosynthesis
MPCCNEPETVKTCVRKAIRWMEQAAVHGEVIVADNGSSDGSQELAEAAGAYDPNRRADFYLIAVRASISLINCGERSNVWNNREIPCSEANSTFFFISHVVAFPAVIPWHRSTKSTQSKLFDA